MADRLTSRQRSALMAGVRTKHTAPELKVRSVAHRLGYRFRLHRKDLPGSPDLVFPRLKAAVFVNGCFWHQHPNCPKSSIPSTRTEFWKTKLARNAARDAVANDALRRAGWRVLVVWECETRDMITLAEKLKRFLDLAASQFSVLPRSINSQR